MPVIGIACTKDCAFVAVLSGTRDHPVVEEARRYPALDPVERGTGLLGIREQLVSLFEKHRPSAVRLRPSGSVVGDAGVKRAYIEGIALEAAAASNVADVSIIKYQTIAKMLGTERKDGDAIRRQVGQHFEQAKGKDFQDAFSAGWAGLTPN